MPVTTQPVRVWTHGVAVSVALLRGGGGVAVGVTIGVDVIVGVWVTVEVGCPKPRVPGVEV